MNQQLLRRAGDALDSFKQAYPENWHEDDEQVIKDLMRADMSMSGVQLKWVGLTDEERKLIRRSVGYNQFVTAGEYAEHVQKATEAKLREKNT